MDDSAPRTPDEPVDQPQGSEQDTGESVTVLEVRAAHRGLLVAGLTVVGLGVGLAAPAVVGWAQGVDWLPFQGPMQLLQKLASTVGGWLLAVIGTVAGAVIGLGLTDELTKLRVTDRDVTFVKGRKKDRFSRAQVTAAVIDDGHLVLRDERDADLIRRDLDVGTEQVRAALRKHNWPLEG